MKSLSEQISEEIRTVLKEDATALGRVFSEYCESGENQTIAKISESSKIAHGTVDAKKNRSSIITIH